MPEVRVLEAGTECGYWTVVLVEVAEPVATLQRVASPGIARECGCNGSTAKFYQSSMAVVAAVG